MEEEEDPEGEDARRAPTFRRAIRGRDDEEFRDHRRREAVHSRWGSLRVSPGSFPIRRYKQGRPCQAADHA
jgi:hypothetical protein